MNAQELNRYLTQFNKDTLVAIRKFHGEGYYSDHNVQILENEHSIILCIGAQIIDFAEATEIKK